MSSKSVPLSVRLSSEDAAFIAGLNAPDAVTMSEKVRYLVGIERLRSEQAETFEGVHDQVSDLLKPVMRELRSMERSTGRSLPILTLIANWLPKMVAELAQGSGTSGAGKTDDFDEASLNEVERESLELMVAFLPSLQAILADSVEDEPNVREKGELADLLLASRRKTQKARSKR